MDFFRTGLPERVFAKTVSWRLGQDIESITSTISYRSEQSEVPLRFHGSQRLHQSMERVSRTLWPSATHHTSSAFTRENPEKEKWGMDVRDEAVCPQQHKH